MNDLVKINNSDLSVKEFNGQRVVTFKDIDRLHERVEGTAKRNFSDNKKHFVEGIDYFLINKSEVGTDFVLSFEFDKFAATGTLITESGYLMLVKSLSDDLAWTVQRELVNKYFRVKNEENTFDMSELSPELQMFNKMLQAVAKSELEQKKIKQQLNEVNDKALEAKEEAVKSREEVQAIREVVAINTSNWREDSRKMIVKMAHYLGGNSYIHAVQTEVYSLMRTRLRCKLDVQLTNMRRRMAEEGVCKSKRDKLNYLDVIERDNRLKEGYLAIVKELAIKYS
ncbi:ORF6N domain-containing protein [Clostridium perfringens]|nr:ORF6N domain-containing protein [Clostridium perfringens]